MLRSAKLQKILGKFRPWVPTEAEPAATDKSPRLTLAVIEDVFPNITTAANSSKVHNALLVRRRPV